MASACAYLARPPVILVVSVNSVLYHNDPVRALRQLSISGNGYVSCFVKAKTHYCDPTRPDPTRPDFVGDPGRRLGSPTLVGSQ